MAQQQQSVLRVYNNSTSGYTYLETYSSVPIKVVRSYAELQDIGKRNSDLIISVQVPGSKKNNAFFESFFDVDVATLFFNATKKVDCDVLINDEVYFRGYLRLNKVSVLNSKVEYDISLYNSVGNLFGDIGNNLLKDLNYADEEYTFNHTFDVFTVADTWGYSNFSLDQEKPAPFFYPIVHNGYLYSGDTVNFTGGTLQDQTRLYTSTAPIGAYGTLADFKTAGGKEYRINTPTQGLINNQLKPALSMWNLLKLMFKTYGYSIKSDFFNTPWMKSLYMYGYFSSPNTKFTFTIQSIQILPLEGVSIFFANDGGGNISPIVVTRDTGIPCYAADDIGVTLVYEDPGFPDYVIENFPIYAGTSGATFNIGLNFITGYVNTPQVGVASSIKYFPVPVNTPVPFVDGSEVNFSTVVDPLIKQIDVLSSIAKKFNLVFVPDPDVKNQIIIEPFSYYFGTGDVLDWTDKLSYDKGFTVEPALNYIESSLEVTDSEDGDYGNQQFKDRNNRIYGQLNQQNPTDFKSQEKRITTIFSPEIIRQWDTADQPGNGGIKIPLGINYAGSSNTSSNGDSEVTNWTYTGIKTKPKLFFNLGAANVFIDQLGEVYNNLAIYKSYFVWLTNSNDTNHYGLETIPIISHTMPIGMADQYKINNDSASILFNSEEATYVDVLTYNAYTENDSYELFYANRVNNLYNADTRFISGNFYLKLNEYANLKANDLIKIKDQYFIWNKIDGYNLTNTELTNVQLVQINNNPSVYPTRYFKYQYCDQTGYSFKLKTDFTNPNLLYTLFGWSILYDYSCGIVYGTNKPENGYVSTLLDIRGGIYYYVPYKIIEITEDEYNNSGYYDWTEDTMMLHIFSIEKGPFGTRMPSFWYGPLFIYQGLNLFTSCSNFYSVASTYGIKIGPSTYYGPVILPSPTPTITPTMTVTPSATPAPVNECVWGQDNLRWNANGTYWGSCDTVAPTPTMTPTNSPTPSITPTLTATPTGTPSVTPTITNTPTMTNTPTPSAEPACFSIGTGFNNGVWGAVQQTDSKIIPYGGFTIYNYIPKNRFVRIKTNGIIDTTYPIGNGFTISGNTVAFVTSGALQSTGKFIAVGAFNQYDNVTSKGIARINTDGTLDTSFNGGNPLFGGAMTDGGVVYVDSSDKIYVGGDFNSYNGSTAYGLLKLNSDGTLDNTWSYSTTGFSRIFRIGQQSSGKMIISCGDIYSSTTVNYIARLNTNGTVDTTFNSGGSGFGNCCTDAIAVQSDDKIIAANRSKIYNGTSVDYILRLNSNGSIDNTFATVGTGFNNIVTRLLILPSGKIMVAGFFTSYNGTSVNRLCRLNSDGSLDTTFNTGGSGFNNLVYGINLLNDGNLLISGYFTTYNGTTANRIVKLSLNGTLLNC
jgi:hypothetical protein